MAQILTRLQEQTVSRLKSNDWGAIKQSDVTRLLTKILDSKEQSTELIPKVIEYEKITHPEKDIKWIEKYISGKLKSKPDRVMFKEVLRGGDYSSFPDKKKKQPAVPSTIEEKAPMSDFSTMKDSKTKKSGSDEQLNKVLESILNNKTETKEPFQGKGIKLGGADTKKTESIDFSGLFKTGTKTYKENKELIDKFKKSLTKEKIDDGSWLTQIASLSQPEIAIIQEVLNNTPLGMSKTDKSNLQKILNRDPSVSTSIGVKTILKSLINPDAIGQIITTQGGKAATQASEKLSDIWSKITTGKGLVTPKDEQTVNTEQLIRDRRAKLEQQEKRKTDLAELGIKTDYEQARYNGYSNLTAEQLTKRPELALEQTTGWEDFGQALQDFFLPTGGRHQTLDTPEKMREYLKKNDPSSLTKFDEQVSKFDNRLKKINMSTESTIDTALHGDILRRVTDYNRTLIKKASSLKALSDQEIEQIYDINSTLEDVLSGKRKITYADLDNSINSIVDITPSSVLNDVSLNTPDFISELKYVLGMNYKGDSDLSTADRLLTEKTKKETIKTPTEETKDPEEPEEPEEPEDPYEKINEKKLDESSAEDTQDTSWSDLRPRLYEGGTNKLLYRSNENVKLSNLVAAASQIAEPGWGNGPDSTMYLNNQIDYKIRYDYTTPMRPIIKQYVPPVRPYQREQAGWSSVLAPVNNVNDDMISSMRCNADIQPFLYFTPSVPQTSYLIFNEQEDYPSFPHQRNERMPCENLKVYNAKLQNLVVRKRTKK